MTYSLAPDVHACLVEGRLVFLDLKHDRYLSLGREQTRMISPLLNISPGTDDDSPKITAISDRGPLVDRLLRQGLLVPAPGISKAAGPITRCPATDFLVRPAARPYNPSPADLANFFAASMRARRMLKCFPIKEIVGRVRSRKTRCGQNNSAAKLEQIHRCVHLFRQLRPFYRRDYLCLFDSLALLEFLSRHQIYPTWIFGVTIEPFEAHCWVQEGDCVLNDSLEAIRRYTPILAI